MGLIILSLFLSLLLVLVSGFSGKSQEDDIVLGMSAAFTGASRSLGIELYRGSMAYIEDINRQGGINGKQIVIQAYDDGYNPTRAIKNTINLIENDDVFLLFDTGIDYTTNLINSQVVPSYNDTSLAAVVTIEH
ncbi:MAG: ABC transporter substrate-binding protein [Moorea sp. SIO3I6]|nr:ABC transporter substrate-binding protein [Moorena sp. SIO3I6]